MRKIIALEKRLVKCRNVLTLGVRTNFNDYTEEEKSMIANSDVIYYPSSFYAGLFEACGKKVFPNFHSYDCCQDKIKQTILFKMYDIPHPETRIFYGKNQKKKILNYFSYPFIAKIPRGSAKGSGVFFINNNKDLIRYLKLCHVSYIQRYIPIDRDIRVIVVGNVVIYGYWRIVKGGEFRCNLDVGSNIRYDLIHSKILMLAYYVALKCGWQDVGIDICCHDGKYYVLEANMKYGYKGFDCSKNNYFKLIEEMIDNEQI